MRRRWIIIKVLRRSWREGLGGNGRMDGSVEGNEKNEY
jgi:hypothetical protein